MTDLYSRYLDEKNRLWIVIERFGSINKNHEIEPSRLKLLDVIAEKAHIVSQIDFDKSIKEKKLKQIK